MSRWPLLVMALSVALFVPAGSEGSGEEKPYKRMFAEPQGFTGYDASVQEPSSLKSVVIGLFLPDGSKDPSALSVARGAQLAVEQANAGGGYMGVPFELRRRWDDNPWAGGARQMVRLVYEDRAWAVIGHTNGASHLAEQVAAKSFVAVIAPVSSDPSLTTARVPWIFRLPPETASQVRLLVGEGLAGRLTSRVGIVTSTDHDGRVTGGEFSRAMQGANMVPAFRLQVPPDGTEIQRVVRQMGSFSPEGLLIHVPPQLVVPLLKTMNEAGIICPVFLPWIPGLDPSGIREAYAGDIISAAPFGSQARNQIYEGFSQDYERSFGTSPPPSAAYGFDAAQLIIEAVMKRGLNRAGVRESIAAAKGRSGATGLISWDNGGGNHGAPVLKEFHGHLPSASAVNP